MDSRLRQWAGTDIAISQAAYATIYGVAAGLVFTQFVLEGEAGIGENLLSVGAPIALGGAVSNIGFPKPTTAQHWYWYLQHGAIAGAVGTGVMMAAGAMPVTFDAATFGFAGLVGASVIIGEMISDAVIGA